MSGLEITSENTLPPLLSYRLGNCDLPGPSVGLVTCALCQHEELSVKILCSEPILCGCGSFPCLNINTIWHFQHVSNCEFSSLLWWVFSWLLVVKV